MSQNSELNDIETILEKLSYLFSSPEGEDFKLLIHKKHYKEAESILLKKINIEDTNIVINYFKNKFNNKFKLVEHTYEEFKIKHPYEGFIVNVRITINYRGDIFSSNLYRNYEGVEEWNVSIGNQQILVKDLDQIWLMEKI